MEATICYIPCTICHYTIQPLYTMYLLYTIYYILSTIDCVAIQVAAELLGQSQGFSGSDVGGDVGVGLEGSAKGPVS